jgi:hypothetical protein
MQFQAQIAILAADGYFGFDINPHLVKATKMNMVMNNDGSGNILQTDSLLPPHSWDADFRESLESALGISEGSLRTWRDLGQFDVIVTNPPFGANLKINDHAILEQFELAHVEVDANSAVAVKKIAPRDDAVLELRFANSVNFPVRADYKGDLPKANVKAEVNGFSVTLTTDKPAFWVWMNAKGIRGEFDDNAVTLVPGNPRTFTFKPKDAITPELFKKSFTVTHLAELCK